MERRRLYVKMDEILDAMDTHGEEPRFFLDLESGDIELWLDPMTTGEEPGFDPDDERYAEIPRTESRDEYRAMEQFATRLEEEDVRAVLVGALGGRGAFARFRDALAGYPDLRARWESEKQQRLLKDALAWFADLGIEPQYELREIPAAPPVGAAEAPPGQARIGLFDMLLLGAAGGGDEQLQEQLINGCVARVFVGPNAEHARKVFARLARELAEHHGLAWRKSMIEGHDRYEVGRCRLSVRGREVHLEIAVPAEIWSAFRKS